MDSDYTQLARSVRKAAETKKAIDPVILDVRGLSGIADFLLIATGSSAPHLKAMDASIAQAMKSVGRASHRACGSPDSGWMVRDYLGLVVHLMTPEMRDYYGIERLWSDAPRMA